MQEAQVYSTAQAAQLLGFTGDNADAKIRRWKSQHSEQFEEGVHYVNQGGSNLWTEAGIAFLSTVIPNATPYRPQRSQDDLGATSPEDLFGPEVWEQMLAIAEQTTVPAIVQWGLEVATRQKIAQWIDNGTILEKASEYAVYMVGSKLTEGFAEFNRSKYAIAAGGSDD